MARDKFIITSSCRLRGEHVPKGRIVEYDLDNSHDADQVAALKRAGRIASATKENVAAIQAEIANEERLEDRANRLTGAKGGGSTAPRGMATA
jgi:hypothetical protein